MNQKDSRSTTRKVSPSIDPKDHQVFQSGAQRGKNRPRFDLLPYQGLRRISNRYELGLKYGRDNWRKGLRDPAFIDQLKCHVHDHLFKYNNGIEMKDDHLAAAAWGLMALMEAEFANPQD